MTDIEASPYAVDPEDPNFVRNDDFSRGFEDPGAQLIAGEILIVDRIVMHPGMCIATRRDSDPRGFVDTQCRYIGAANPRVYLSVSYIMDVAQKLAGVPSKTEFKAMQDELQELREYKTRVEPMVQTVEAFKTQHPTGAPARKTTAKK